MIMKSSRNFSLITFSAATIVVCCCYFVAAALAAPRNGPNRMPTQYGSGNSDYSNNNNYQGQHYVGAGQQVDPDESNQSEINDESGAVDPEFASLTDDGSPESAASNSEADETDEPTPGSALDQAAANGNSWLGSSPGRITGSGSSSSEVADELYGGEPRGQDSNIANAKIKLSSTDMSTAAGHHYHGHGVHGWLEMGAHTGKKGAFGWHDKHPVGGKGRR